MNEKYREMNKIQHLPMTLKPVLVCNLPIILLKLQFVKSTNYSAAGSVNISRVP